MENLRDLRRRIRAIRSTQQITHSMKLVSTARFARVQSLLFVCRKFSEEWESGASFLPFSSTSHTLLDQRSDGTVLLIPITSDRGLCGAYNVNLLRYALSFASSLPPDTDVQWLTIGRKGTVFLRWRKHQIVRSYHRLPITLPLKVTQSIVRDILHLYEREPIREVHLFFTRFVSMGKQIADRWQLLPITPPRRKESPDEIPYFYEPEPEEMLWKLLPQLLTFRLHLGLFESFASEQAARMLAMSQASENAEELIRELNLRYNRARQESITKELMDIVGGAEVLKL